MVSKMAKNKIKKETSTDLRGLCLIHDRAHMCNQDFLEAETVVQLPNPPYSLYLSPCDFFLFTLLKNNLSRRGYEPKSAVGSARFQCLQGVPK